MNAKEYDSYTSAPFLLGSYLAAAVLRAVSPVGIPPTAPQSLTVSLLLSTLSVRPPRLENAFSIGVNLDSSLCEMDYFPPRRLLGSCRFWSFALGMSFIFTLRGTVPAPLQNFIDTGGLFNFFPPDCCCEDSEPGPPPALWPYDLTTLRPSQDVLDGQSPSASAQSDLFPAFSSWLMPDCLPLHIQVFHYFKTVSFCYTLAYLFVLFLKNTNYVLYFFPLSLFVWQNCHLTAVISPQMSVRRIQLWFLEGFYLFSFVFSSCLIISLLNGFIPFLSCF